MTTPWMARRGPLRLAEIATGGSNPTIRAALA